LDPTKESDQEVAEGCKRLIEDAIVGGNSLDPTRKIAEAPDAEAPTALRESVIAGPASSWHPIDRLGA
jgi:hypothetical protein